MCETCGCSDDSSVRITDPAERRSAHGLGYASFHALAEGAPHQHEHSHGHDHSHEHPHDHDHVHGHDHNASRTIRIEQDVLAKNELIAERNRGWFKGRGILALNLMSSPGAGKTTLLERTIAELANEVPISVIEGDQETMRDAERIRAAGARAIQINTGSGCHLDAQMVSMALAKLGPPVHSVMMIENVGNLVCPALFDLGEAEKVVIVSATEGEDKPLKYPHMFHAAGLMLLNKIDLIPHLEFDVERCIRFAQQVNPNLEILRVSARTGDGIDRWFNWLRARIEKLGTESAAPV